jgi:hypothetical protein
MATHGPAWTRKVTSNVTLYLTRVEPGAEVGKYRLVEATLRVERAIVRQRVDDVKTVYSGRLMSIDSGMAELLKSWRQTTQSSDDNDWVFASPVKLGLGARHSRALLGRFPKASGSP